MTVDPNSIDLPAFMAEHLQRAEPDLLRTMLSAFVQALMSAEADAICDPPYGERRAATRQCSWPAYVDRRKPVACGVRTGCERSVR